MIIFVNVAVEVRMLVKNLACIDDFVCFTLYVGFALGLAFHFQIRLWERFEM